MMKFSFSLVEMPEEQHNKLLQQYQIQVVDEIPALFLTTTIKLDQFIRTVNHSSIFLQLVNVLVVAVDKWSTSVVAGESLKKFVGSISIEGEEVRVSSYDKSYKSQGTNICIQKHKLKQKRELQY